MERDRENKHIWRIGGTGSAATVQMCSTIIAIYQPADPKTCSLVYLYTILYSANIMQLRHRLASLV